MTGETSAWDASEYLRSREDIAAYLNAVLKEGDPALVQAALGDIAKSIGMTEIARETGLGRESLYKSLREGASPSFRTISKVAAAVGAPIEFRAAAPDSAGEPPA